MFIFTHRTEIYSLFAISGDYEKSGGLFPIILPPWRPQCIITSDSASSRNLSAFYFLQMYHPMPGVAFTNTFIAAYIVLAPKKVKNVPASF